MGCWAALSEEEGRGRKDGGMEKGERGQKGGGGRTVKHSWRSVDQTYTLILTHTQTQTHTVHIKRKTEPMWSWRFICWCTTNSFWVVMWNWSDAHLHEPSVSADFVAVFPSYSFNLSLRRLCKTGCYQSKRIKSSKKNHQDHSLDLEGFCWWRFSFVCWTVVPPSLVETMVSSVCKHTFWCLKKRSSLLQTLVFIRNLPQCLFAYELLLHHQELRN